MPDLLGIWDSAGPCVCLASNPPPGWWGSGPTSYTELCPWPLFFSLLDQRWSPVSSWRSWRWSLLLSEPLSDLFLKGPCDGNFQKTPCHHTYLRWAWLERPRVWPKPTASSCVGSPPACCSSLQCQPTAVLWVLCSCLDWGNPVGQNENVLRHFSWRNFNFAKRSTLKGRGMVSLVQLFFSIFVPSLRSHLLCSSHSLGTFRSFLFSTFRYNSVRWDRLLSPLPFFLSKMKAQCTLCFSLWFDT